MRSRPPDFKKEDFFFSTREEKLFFTVVRTGGIVAGAALMLVLILGGLVSSIRQLDIAGRAEQARRDAVTRTEVKDWSERLAANDHPTGTVDPAAAPALHPTSGISLNDFILPNEAAQLADSDWTFFRERTGHWDAPAVDEYWIPPARSGLEKLRKLNDKNIEMLLEDIP